MNELEMKILENLKSGQYDGSQLEYWSGGNARHGGAYSKGFCIRDGQLVMYKDLKIKSFDGKENNCVKDRTERIVESDTEKLDIIQRFGYKLYDFPDIRDYSKAGFEERDRRIAATRAAAMQKIIEEQSYIEEDSHLDKPDESDNIDNIYCEVSNSSLVDGIKIIAAIGGICFSAYCAVKVVPHIKKWWTEKATPIVEEKWRMFTHNKHQKDDPADIPTGEVIAEYSELSENKDTNS